MNFTTHDGKKVVDGISSLWCVGADPNRSPSTGRSKRRQSDNPGKRAYHIFIDCFQRGALVRAAGDVLVIAPPFIVEKGHVETLVGTLAYSGKKNA